MDTFCEYYCLDIIVGISSLSALNITVNTTPKCYRNQALNDKLKLMEGVIRFFGKSYNEILSSLLFFCEIKTGSPPSK